MARKSAKKTKKATKSGPKCPLPSSRNQATRTTRSSSISKVTNLPKICEENFRNIIKSVDSEMENNKILLVTFAHQEKIGICKTFVKNLEREIDQKAVVKNIRFFEKSSATDILDSIDYLFNSKAIRTIEKLIPKKSCILAISKVPLINSYELLGYTENIEENSQRYVDAAAFYKKIIKVHKKFLLEHSNISSTSKRSTTSVGKNNNRQKLISYQDFQYKLTSIRDEMRNLRIAVQNSRKGKKSSKNLQKFGQKSLFRDIKILFSNLNNGHAELVKCNESETLAQVLSRSRDEMAASSDDRETHVATVKTFWPNKHYDLSSKIVQYDFLNYQVLYVE